MKARFIHHLVQERGSKADFSELAKETGTRMNIIRDNYITYRILLQARDEFEIDVTELEKDFSVFYRAFSDRAIINFVGLNKTLPLSKLKRPIPSAKAKDLEDLIGFIHGTKDVKPVIRDSRQLSKLGDILERKQALTYLRTSRNFEQAYILSGGEAKRLLENMESAIVYMKEALRDVFQYKKDQQVKDTFSKLWSVALEIKKSFPDPSAENHQ
jgi:soluble cytochrome b562